MKRFVTRGRWRSLVYLLAAVVVLGLLPAPAARAETARADSQSGDGWKPRSTRNWWDRLWGLHDGNHAPKRRDLKVGAVPRRDPLPKGVKEPPARRVAELTGRRTAQTMCPTRTR